MGDISANFSRAEFACKCGCGFNTVDAELLRLLEAIRAQFGGRPVKVNSGCRCPAYNAKIGGEKASLHMQGRAADIDIDGVPPSYVADYAERVGVPGVGRYAQFTHIDSRSGHARWKG